MAEVEIVYGEGISKESEIIDLAANASIIDKTGAWYSYNGEKLGQGKENVKALLKSDTKLKNELEAKVREYYGLTSKKVDNKKEKVEE